MTMDVIVTFPETIRKNSSVFRNTIQLCGLYLSRGRIFVYKLY
jgi:hypothetical protein